MLDVEEIGFATSMGGLPPPRWARSAYDRGLEEIHDLLDLLWGFSALLRKTCRYVCKLNLSPAAGEVTLALAK